MFSQSIARFQGASPAAASTIIKLAIDPITPAATKLRAAESILDRAAKAMETEDIQARLTAVERAVAATKGKIR